MEEYLKHASRDELYRMIEVLTTEVWVLRDRLTAVEVLLERSDVLSRDAVDRFSPEGEVADELGRERRWLVARVFGEPIGIPASPVSPGASGTTTSPGAASPGAGSGATAPGTASASRASR